MPDAGNTLTDLLATASAAQGVDICILRFQQLPPLGSGLFDFNQNEVDLQTLMNYTDMMTQGFYDLGGETTNGGGIILAGCTVDSGGARALCDAGIILIDSATHGSCPNLSDGPRLSQAINLQTPLVRMD